MKRRLLAAAAALLLATIGGLTLVKYVASADQRALEGVATVDVLVVTQNIAKGTPAADILGSVELKSLPAIAVTSASLSRLDQIGGQVTTADLVPGEQLITSRFVDPSSLLAPGEVAVPDGLQQLSIELNIQRAVGGAIEAGDKVAVYLSYKEPDSTHLTLHRVLVTRVQQGAVGDGDQAPAAPEGSVLVTLAATGADAEKVVFAAEHGTVWLTVEPEDADTTKTKVLTKGNLFQ